MKIVLKALLVIAIALILGVGSAFYVLSNPQKARSGYIANGPWATSLTFGSASAGMYEKAVVAKMGLFALNKKETIYYTAMVDSNGNRLDTKFQYRIDGDRIDTRWWSLTAYGEDHFLIPNKHKKYAVSINGVERKADGGYTILLSRNPQKGNWIPTGDQDQNFSLTLRLYNPSRAVYENLETMRLPRITREVSQ